ncbi:MAG: helix-turn-helix domain-containing protein [Planctomycetes bacterium]|nr:helix-turn-helix domain-containing protein [Planctomycetota bacterium]
MPNDLEIAFRGLLKIVVQEVASELQSREQLLNHMNSEQDSCSEGRLLLRAKEVAERLAISERHLYKMTVDGGLPCVRIGQSVRYRVKAVQDWLREAESTEAPQPRREASVKKKSINNKQPKITRKSKQKKVPAKERSSSRAKHESEQDRPNPFRLLLKKIGVDRDLLGPLTNGELRQIAEVDLPTFNGWMYKGRDMPEVALEKLRKHFSIQE